MFHEDEMMADCATGTDVVCVIDGNVCGRGRSCYVHGRKTCKLTKAGEDIEACTGPSGRIFAKLNVTLGKVTSKPTTTLIS